VKGSVIAVSAIAVLIVGGIVVGNFVSSLFRSIGDSQSDVTTLASEASAAITKNWDPATLQAYASQAYVDAILKRKDAAWQAYKTLGPATSIEPCKIEGLNITNGAGRGQVTCLAEFAAGEAALRFNVDNKDGSWKIDALSLVL